MVEIITAEEFDCKIEQTAGISMVLLIMSNCGFCKTAKQQLDEDFGEIHKIYVMDVTDDLEFAEKHNINAVPMLFIYKDGSFVTKSGAVLDREHIKGKVRVAESS